jgi:hypothetical protein
MTLSARLDASLEGGTLSVQVDAQVAKLGTVLTLVQRLATDPPREVGDLEAALGAIPLPDLGLPADLAGRVAGLATAVPADPAGVIAPLLGRLESIGTDFGGALGQRLAAVLAVTERVHALTRIDVDCGRLAVGAPGGGAGDGTGSGGGGAGGAAPRSATRETVAGANAVLDGLPDPLDVRGLFAWIHERTTLRRDHPLLPAVIPLLDEVRDPVGTLLEWEALDGPGIRAHMIASIGEAEAFLRGLADRATADLAADLATRAAAVPAADLVRIATDMQAALVALRAAATAGDPGGAGTAAADLNALLDEYDALRPPLAAGPLAHAADVGRRIRAVPAQLEEAVAHAIGLLGTGGSLLALLPAGLEAPGVAGLERWLVGIGDWLQDVADALDVESIRAPLAEVADGARDVADGLDEGIAALTIEVQGLFGELEQLLDRIDVAGATADLEAAIDRMRDELVVRIAQAAAPARDALAAAVTAIDDAVQAFDPAAVTGALEQAVQAVAGVLTDPAVAVAIAQVRGVLETATSQIEALSFAPVTDQVVDVIEDVTAALASIDPGVLPPPATAALNAAVAVLPSSLKPVTDPIIVDFGGLVESGPVRLLERIREQPARVLEQVRRFEPAALIGDALSAPFRDLLREADRVRPGAALEPVRREFDALKASLRRSARPSQAVAPLQAQFARVQSAFEALDPTAITAPLDAALSDAVDTLMGILPVDQTFAAIDAVLGAVRRVMATADEVTALVRRLQQVLAALADGPRQLEDWIDAVLDRIERIPDTAPLAAPLAALRDAVDGLREDGVRQRLADAVAPMHAVCDAVQGAERLAALVGVHRAVPRAAVEALPAGPERTAALAALDRLDPLAPAFGSPYKALGDIGRAIAQTTAALEDRLAGWDDRYHEPGGVLDAMRRTAATPAELRQWAGETLDAQVVRPVNRAFGVVTPTAALLDSLLERVEAVLAALQHKLDDLLLGPDALGGIRDALGEVVDRITGFDLAFLAQALQSAFDTVRAKLDAVAPARFGQVVDARFGQVLDTLSLDLVLPPAQVAAIDASYRAAIDRLRALDPGPIVADAVQPVWDATVPPLVDALDVTALLDGLIAKLRELDGELRIELGRVDDAYRGMLAAVPPFEPSLDIGVGVSF